MKHRILVIEDDMDISNLICMNLEAAGYEAEPVYDGRQAQERIEKRTDVDLALLDLMLPGIDGFSLIGPLSKHQIPVICLTAKGDVISKVQGLRMGAEDYMVKPFEVLELLVRIESLRFCIFWFGSRKSSPGQEKGRRNCIFENLGWI